jgi:hypothetical protein
LRRNPDAQWPAWPNFSLRTGDFQGKSGRADRHSSPGGQITVVSSQEPLISTGHFTSMTPSEAEPQPGESYRSERIRPLPLVARDFGVICIELDW